MQPQRSSFFPPVLCVLAVLYVLGVLAGCTAGPSYHRPQVAVPPSFKEGPPPSQEPPWKPATPQDEAHRGAWWSVFGDPELDRLEERISVANPSLARAEAQFRGARAAIRGVRA